VTTNNVTADQAIITDRVKTGVGAPRSVASPALLAVSSEQPMPIQALQAADPGLLRLSRMDRLACKSFHSSSNRSSLCASLSQSSASFSHACLSSAPAAFALLRHSKALRQNSSGFDMIRNHRELSAPNPDEISFRLMIQPQIDAHQAWMNARAPLSTHVPTALACQSERSPGI